MRSTKTVLDRLWVGAGVGALSLLMAGGAVAAPMIEFSPTSLSVAAGDTFSIAVSANAETPPLGCFAITVDYDPAVLELVGATEGSLFAAAIDPTFFSVQSDSTDRNVVSNCVLGFGTSVTPPGELAVLRFTAIAAGPATITVAEATLRDVDRIQIAGVLTDSVSVGIGATGAPISGPLAGRSLGAQPNPTASIMQLRLLGAAEGSSTGAREIEIFDLAGRRVRTLNWRGDIVGTRWDGRDSAGRRVGAGVYFAVLRTSDGPLRTKLVRLD